MTAETGTTTEALQARYAVAGTNEERVSVALEALELVSRKRREMDPWEIRLLALHYAQRERAKLVTSAFLWSILTALAMLAVLWWLP